MTFLAADIGGIRARPLLGEARTGARRPLRRAPLASARLPRHPADRP